MLKLGLYGCGNRTKALLNALINDKFYCVHAAYDLNPESASLLTAKYGGTVCKTPDELVNFDGVDAFFISLSPFAHAEALRRTIPTGKPIFVEKPVSFSSDEIFALAELAKKHNTPVQVGFMRRYLPQSIAVLDFIRENVSGRLFSVDCNWFHRGDTEMNFCLYHQPDNFRLKVSQIPFHCCHMLDILLLMGGPVKRVTSQVIKVVDRPYPSPDDVIANLEFTNGANGRFHYSSMVYYGEMSYRFHAENYSIRMDCGPNNLEIHRLPRFYTSKVGPEPENKKDFTAFNETYESFCHPEIRNFSQGLNAANENIMFDFVRAARDGVTPKANLFVAAQVQGLAEAIESSGRIGRSIELDPNGLPIK